MPHDQLPRDPFTRAVDRPDEAINLARTALLIAQDEYPNLHIDAHMAQLDEMAEALRRRVVAAHTSDDIIEILNSYLIHSPDAPDADTVRGHMKRLITQIARWN